MTITKTFTKKDQLDAEGKKIDDIFTINQVETIEKSNTWEYSGTEVLKKLAFLEIKRETAEKTLLAIQEEINFYKSFK